MPDDRGLPRAFCPLVGHRPDAANGEATRYYSNQSRWPSEQAAGVRDPTARVPAPATPAAPHGHRTLEQEESVQARTFPCAPARSTASLCAWLSSRFAQMRERFRRIPSNSSACIPRPARSEVLSRGYISAFCYIESEPSRWGPSGNTA